jgi:ferric-dicitrate binding protein FerR (iron transport regulator)
MTKEQAIILLQRYRQGVCSGEEKQAVERWYASLEAKGEWKWTDEEKALFGEELFERIAAEVAEDGKGKVIQMFKRLAGWKVAAAVLLLGATTFMWILLSGDN